MALLIRTPQATQFLNDLFQRSYALKECNKELYQNVEGVNLYEFIEKLHNELIEEFVKVGDFPVVQLSERHVAGLLILGDITGEVFANYGNLEKDGEFLKNLTEFFDQYKTEGQEYNRDDVFKIIKETELKAS